MRTSTADPIMIYVDLPFYLAVAAIGFGLSLNTYRLFAGRYDWPMGAWQTERPALPFLIGLGSIIVGVLFAIARFAEGGTYAAGAIAAFALTLAILWTGLMRVASQTSLFLAPASAALLFVVWNFGVSALHYETVHQEIRQLRQDLHDQFGLKSGTVTPPPATRN